MIGGVKFFHKIREQPLILPIYLPSFMGAFCNGLLIPVLPLYIISFDVTYVVVGLFLASSSIGMLVSDVPAGVILRRWGEKKSMLLGLVFTTLATFALIWAKNIPQVLTLRLIAGFGMALYGISRHTYISDIVAINDRGRVGAFFGGIMRVGKFTGPAIGGLIATFFGLWAVFVLFTVIYVLIFVIVVSFVAHRDLPALNSSSHQANLLYETIITQYRILITAGVGQIFGQIVRSGVVTIIPLYAAEVLGLKIAAIGLILSIAAGFELAFVYPAGLIMDRRGRKHAIIPCFLIQAIGLALLPFTYSFISLLMISSLIGIGNGLGSGTMLTLGSDLAPKYSRAEFLSLWRFIGDLGHTCGPLAVGMVTTLATMQIATWIISIAGLSAVLIFKRHVPETLKNSN